VARSRATPVGSYTFVVPTTSVRSLGLLGGTFDPPHIGHVVAAVEALDALRLDAVWLVVANRPWQKVADRTITPADARVAMVRAAIDGVHGLKVSTLEVERGGNSYTADTLAEIRAVEPQTRPFVIVGADAAAGLRSWERAEEVRDNATMVLVDRPGLETSALPVGWDFERVVIPRLDVSSTDLRARVQSGKPIDGLVSPGVIALIRQWGLYCGSRV
jgi:nicotinate-nucleotide adenylyltransferase